MSRKACALKVEIGLSAPDEALVSGVFLGVCCSRGRRDQEKKTISYLERARS